MVSAPKVVIVCPDLTPRQAAQMQAFLDSLYEPRSIMVFPGRAEVFGCDKIEGADMGEVANTLVEFLDDPRRQALYERLNKMGCRMK